MEIKKIGVVGCGLMGGGIAQLAAQAGYQVVVTEENKELLGKGLGAIEHFMGRAVEKGRMNQADKEAALSRLKGSVDMNDFAECDLVIEAVIENMDLKHDIFSKLDKICPKEAILATNTYCLSIIDIARATSKPEKVLGVHFFNPATIMKLLELVRTVSTSDDTIETARKVGENFGKTIIEAKDTPGFVVNRLFIPFMLHSIQTYEVGIASREDIDTGINLGLGHPMGPLTLADFTGLDTILYVADSIYQETKDPRYVAPVLLRKMVAAGWLGRKTGKGLYDYNK